MWYMIIYNDTLKVSMKTLTWSKLCKKSSADFCKSADLDLWTFIYFGIIEILALKTRLETFSNGRNIYTRITIISYTVLLHDHNNSTVD